MGPHRPSRAGVHQQTHHTEWWPPLFGAVVSTGTTSEPGEPTQQQVWPAPRDWKEHGSGRGAGPHAPHSSHLQARLPPSCRHALPLSCAQVPLWCSSRTVLSGDHSGCSGSTHKARPGSSPSSHLPQVTPRVLPAHSPDAGLGAQFCLCSLKRRHDWVAGSGWPRSQPKP